MSYLKRFKEMVEEISKDETFEIVEFKIMPPISKIDLKKIEYTIGAAFSASIRSFYLETNGLHLRWRINPLLNRELTKQLKKKSSDYSIVIAETEYDAFTRINLLPLYESIIKRDWKESRGEDSVNISFNGQNYKYADFRKKIKPFDLFSLENCMAFFIEPGNGEPLIMMLTDFYTEWSNSRLTNFESYLEFLLSTRGIVEAREKIFADLNGNLKKPLVGDKLFWKKKTPKLFC